jgi:hypothetical protein
VSSHAAPTATELKVYYEKPPKGSTPRGLCGKFFYYTFKAEGDASPPSRDDPYYKVKHQPWEKAALAKRCATMKSKTVKKEYDEPVQLPPDDQLLTVEVRTDLTLPLYHFGVGATA